MDAKNKFRKSDRVLLDERPLVLLPSLATAVGTDEAIVIQQLHFHLANPNNGRIQNRERWIFKTYEDWHKDDFPFWSERTIRRIFTALEKRGLIVSCQPEGRESRRKYYRIDYDALTRARGGCGQNRRIDAARNSASSLSETTHAKTTSNNAHHRAAMMSSKDDLSGYCPEELEVIKVYHDLLCDNDSRWKRVNKYKEAVSDALATAGENAQRLIELAADGDSRVAIPKQRTLVRLLWENWQSDDLEDDQ